MSSRITVSYVFVAISSMILFTIESPFFYGLQKFWLSSANPSHNYLVPKNDILNCWWQPEIRQAPVEGTVVYLPLFKQGFIYTSQGGCLGFLPPMLYQCCTRVGRSSLLKSTAPKPWVLRRKPRIGRTFCQGTVQQYLWVGTLTRMQKKATTLYDFLLIVPEL